MGEAASGTIYGAGAEGESLKQTGSDAAGTFGLTLLSNGVAPNYGVVAHGSLNGVHGQAGNAGLSSTGPAERAARDHAAGFSYRLIVSSIRIATPKCRFHRCRKQRKRTLSRDSLQRAGSPSH